MTDNDPIVPLDNFDADALWDAWAPPGDEDILARAAFERALRFAIDLEDEGLYFRPGGWVVNLPATAARIACAAAVLAASFQLAGLEGVDSEVVIAAAGLVASMDVRPVRLSRQERRLADRLRAAGLEGQTISAGRAHRALPKSARREVSRDEVADALDRLAAAGLADQEGENQWVLRAKGSEAWIRLRLTGWEQ
ncbi:MAG: hypothetical protein OEW30_20785 [Acidimicrobiia bacterium]|nr:hypothetical protein [Acidimicrobiia bacterium]